MDYMYAKAGIKYSYAVHLRDTGTVRLLVVDPTLSLILSVVRLPPPGGVDPTRW